MRAVVARTGRQGCKLQVEDLPSPEPGPAEALVRTLACGICGSDLHFVRHAERVAQLAQRAEGLPRVDPKRGVVLGHEFCAEVVDYGPGTQRRFKPGTRVCAEPVLLTPSGMESIGFSNQAPGGFGEHMRLMADLLIEVPNGLPAAHAALTEPMAVGVHAVAKAELGKNDAALVIGCGPVGLAVIAALRLRGVRPIVAADFAARRRRRRLIPGTTLEEPGLNRSESELDPRHPHSGAHVEPAPRAITPRVMSVPLTRPL